MPDFTFRFRIRLAPGDRIGFADSLVSLTAVGFPSPLEIHPRNRTHALKDAEELVFRASGFTDEAAARSAAEALQADLKRTFARLWMAADFGVLASKSFIFKAGLEMLREPGGPPVMNDEPGIVTFETRAVRFASVGDAKGIRSMQPERFERVLRHIRTRTRPLTRKEELAFELYSGSFFQTEPRARFLLLFMAVEALVLVEERPDVARKLIESFIKQVHDCGELPADERSSLQGGLARLLGESIAAAAHRLTRERLDGRNYMEKSATDFFRHCNRLRGRMVHGMEADMREVRSTAAELQMFVADLLAFDLLDIEV